MDELLKEIVRELREMNKKIDSLGSAKTEPDELIDLDTFAERIHVHKSKAITISQQLDLCEKGIAVSLNGDKKGGKRIHWQAYLEYIKNHPAVPESKRA